jgi:hypothetical protein
MVSSELYSSVLDSTGSLFPAHPRLWGSRMLFPKWNMHCAYVSYRAGVLYEGWIVWIFNPRDILKRGMKVIILFREALSWSPPTRKTSGFKTSGFKTSGFKTSGLPNVRFTKRQVSKRLVSKHPVFKFDILIKQKVFVFVIFTYY